MITKQPIILLNFTGVYDYEVFASSPCITHVDCHDISGVDCYCDEEARAELRRRLAPYPARRCTSSIRAISIISRSIGCRVCASRSR